VLSSDILLNVILMLLCYAYIVLVIFVSGKLGCLNVSRRSSRKFLHIMIGNLPFVIPFFTYNSFPLNFPFFVAAPFVLVTFLACPYSPFKGFYEKMKGLTDITEEGHQLGLVFYAVSYTFLALFFSSKPQVIAAGILPMAYGDAFASFMGERYGKRKYRILAAKSLEGSAAMFLASFLSFTFSLIFFSAVYSFSFFDGFWASLGVALIATLVEGLSPHGFDNIAVPALSALTFLALGGGT